MTSFFSKIGFMLTILLCGLLTMTRAQVRVVLDNYYNHELQPKTGQPYHYLWSDHENSGFSEWGDIFRQQKASIDTLQQMATTRNLSHADVYIIVDPDTKAETPNPHYLEKPDIKAIVRWVKRGGVLVLMANDSGNCDFQHLNQLAKNFGMHFNEVSVSHVVGTQWEMGAITEFPSSPIFKGVKKIYIKDASTLELQAPATAILTKNGNVLMAQNHLGKGYVIAITDPWIYNEYIGHRNLPADFDNYRAAGNFTEYLISLSEGRSNKLKEESW